MEHTTFPFQLYRQALYQDPISLLLPGSDGLLTQLEERLLGQMRSPKPTSMPAAVAVPPSFIVERSASSTDAKTPATLLPSFGHSRDMDTSINPGQRRPRAKECRRLWKLEKVRKWILPSSL
ncbi:hypothetical protein Cadr_000012382 [Camelus dromedarius]|uniref:Uncharacterized protein n=1 Tax=Camelus dromedarius TaxID=9838 RepID=A0A5N4DS09_CAMDR|nr:hypothetical protein Cadr_000012382 [Camelus dromedarius]